MIQAAVIKLDKEYKIKPSWGGMMLFEDMTKKTIYSMEDSVSDVLKLFYCLLKANNEDFKYTFEEFVKLLDNYYDQVDVFVGYLEGLKEGGEIKKKTVRVKK